MKRFFITGIAGFIGFHVARRLYELGHFVTGLDSFDPYYDVRLKNSRRDELEKLGITVIEEPISSKVLSYLEEHQISHLIHLAAQAGVRYSLEAPYAYLEANLKSFLDILEAVKNYKKAKLLFASSSSVYGEGSSIPFHEKEICDRPLNLYGATKRSNEVMAYSYHHLYDIPMIGLRFFTVYGPWGRPDMAYYSFTESILKEQPIKLHNNGVMERDFTYIDDIVDGTLKAVDAVSSFSIYNLGKGEPFLVSRMVRMLEEKLQKKANIISIPIQPGELTKTFADITKAKNELGYSPKVSLEEGISSFLSWYENYNDIVPAKKH